MLTPRESAAKLSGMRAGPITLHRLSLEELPNAPGVPGISIYTAVQHDYPAIAAILNESFPDRAFCAESVWKSIVAPAYAFCTFVALERSSLVVATCSARKRYGVGEVAWAACRPSHRRRGITTALVQHTLLFLRQQGFSEACAVLNPATEESLGFWGACGFFPKGGTDA